MRIAADRPRPTAVAGALQAPLPGGKPWAWSCAYATAPPQRPARRSGARASEKQKAAKIGSKMGAPTPKWDPKAVLTHWF